MSKPIIPMTPDLQGTIRENLGITCDRATELLDEIFKDDTVGYSDCDRVRHFVLLNEKRMDDKISLAEFCFCLTEI